MKNYLICYDITNPKRLAKVKKIAYSYALGGQKSAVEAPLDDRLLKELISKLKKIIKKGDRVNIIEYQGEPLYLGKADFIRFDGGIILL